MFRDDRRPDQRSKRDQRQQRALDPQRTQPAPQRQPTKPAERPTATGPAAQTPGQPLLGAKAPTPRDVRPGLVQQRDTAAALAAMAHGRPTELAEALRAAGGDAVGVRFLQQQAGGASLPVWQPLTAKQLSELRELAAEHGAGWSELWPAVVEQALAGWRGEAALSTPGRSGDVLTALTGHAVRELPTAIAADRLWQALCDACGPEGAGPVVTCTVGGDDDPERPREFQVHVVTAIHDEASGPLLDVLDPLTGETRALSLAEFRHTYDAVAIVTPTVAD